MFLFDLVAAAVAQSSTVPAAVCDVGRAALRDLPSIETDKNVETYYAGVDAEHRDVLEVCPQLRSALPARFPLADDNARARASVHVPAPGMAARGTFIYAVGVPELGDDRKTAIVRFDYSCSGLCGGTLVARYVKTANGWKKEPGWVSAAVS